MLRISKLADYGTVIMAEMARAPSRLVSASELSSETGLAHPTVSKVLKQLALGNLVVSQLGKHGGYVLARPASAISIAAIIDTIDGAFGLTECANHPGACLHEPSCRIRQHWRRVDRAVRGALEGISLAQMIDLRPSVVDFVASPVRRGAA